MIKTLQLEEKTTFRAPLHDEPNLLIEWSSPWEEFVTSIGPAFSRSAAKLAGEAPYGLRPYRGILLTWAMEAFLLFVLIVLPIKIAQLRPYVAPKLASHDVIYYSGDELPQMEDLGGTHAGTSGRSGGDEAHHRTQTIRIARGGSLVEKVVDTPNLKLPASTDAVANLLVIKPNPGPPPLEGSRSTRATLTLPADVIAPAPNVTPDYTRGTVSTPSVIPPAPSVSRDHSLNAPSLNATVIAPAPNISREHALVAPRLDTSVVAPAPNVAHERSRSAPALNGTVIPPAPTASNPEVSRSPVQANVAVVPPPVSAPEHQASRVAKLTMPAPSVVAPPPSADMSRDLHRLASGNMADPSKSVVPPPPAPQANTGLLSSLVGKIFGTTDVVPPPPNVNTSNDNSRSAPGVAGRAMSPNVVAPPPSVSEDGNDRALGRSTTGSMTQNVVAPPPTVSGSTRSLGSASNAAGERNGTLLAGNVVPPPPSLGGGSSPSGSGRGATGSGLGGALDRGSVLAPPNAGSGAGSSVIVSNQPGSKLGVPGNTSAGALAMSPTGGDKPGIGGNGGGGGTAKGTGPGSGATGESTGAAKIGTGRGADPNAHGGISPTPGPGGAGSATSGTPVVPGVSISGGSTAIVNLPSFGSDPGSSPTIPARSPVKQQPGPAITIMATARSGGAFNRYGELPGDNYTVYFDTPFGPASMQFADPPPTSASPRGQLVSPQLLRGDLPTGLPRAPITVRCVLDATGNLKVLSLLESSPPDTTVKVLAAIAKWKFRPAMHGDQPIEVQAILGFNTNTDDKF